MRHNLFFLSICSLPGLFLLAGLFAGAHAQENIRGWDAYVEGNFSQARRLAQSSDDRNADAFALACRSGLVIGGFFETGAASVQSLHQALADCSKAISLDSDHYVAGISHAIALGFEGLRLRKAAYAKASRREIEALMKSHPDNALATGALAGWHAAVAREGWLARLFLGASRARARILYEKAVTLPNAELPLLYEYARFLSAGNAGDREQAATLIESLSRRQAKDGLEKLLLEKSATLLTALQSDRKNALRDALSASTPFEGIDEWGDPALTRIEPYELRSVTQ